MEQLSSQEELNLIEAIKDKPGISLLKQNEEGSLYKVDYHLAKYLANKDNLLPLKGKLISKVVIEYKVSSPLHKLELPTPVTRIKISQTDRPFYQNSIYQKLIARMADKDESLVQSVAMDRFSSLNLLLKQDGKLIPKIDYDFSEKSNPLTVKVNFG